MDYSVARAVPGAPLQLKSKVMSKPMTEVGFLQMDVSP